MACTLALLLTLWGYDVKTEHEGAAALDTAQAFDPAVIVLDLRLPDLDGFEVARRLRARGWSGLLVAWTGFGRPEDQRRSREAGFDHHLVKPVGLERLRELLRAGAPA